MFCKQIAYRAESCKEAHETTEVIFAEGSYCDAFFVLDSIENFRQYRKKKDKDVFCKQARHQICLHQKHSNNWAIVPKTFHQLLKYFTFYFSLLELIPHQVPKGTPFFAFQGRQVLLLGFATTCLYLELFKNIIAVILLFRRISKTFLTGGPTQRKSRFDFTTLNSRHFSFVASVQFISFAPVLWLFTFITNLTYIYYTVSSRDSH